MVLVTRRLTKKRLWIFATTITLGALMLYLESQGVPTSHSGDMICGGDKTCYGYFNFTVPAKVTNYLGEVTNITALCFGNNLRVVLTNPEKVNGLGLYKADKRYRADNPARWKPFNFTGSCIPTGENEFMINATKDLYSIVKWAIEGTDIDPKWIGENVSAITTYDYNSVTECIGKTCTATIGGSYAYDNGQWKSIDEAKSLKNSSVKCSVKSDGMNIANCLDWNTTSITVNLSNKNILSIVSIPIKVYAPNVTKNVSELTGDYKKDYLIKSSANLSFLSKNDVKTRVIPFALGDILEFGENSTTITLNYTTGKGYVFNNTQSATWNDIHDATGGTSASTSYLFVGCRWDTIYTRSISRGFIPLNSSIIPDDAVLLNVTFSFYIDIVTNTANDGSDYIALVGPTTQASFSTLGVDDYDQCGSVNSPTIYSNKIDISTISVNNWYMLIVNSSNLSFINKTGITPFGIREGHDIDDVAMTGNINQITTVENASFYSYFNITYYVPGPDITPPTYSDNSTNYTGAGKPIEFRLKWNDTDDGLGDAGLSKAITSLWNGSAWVNASSWCSLSGTSYWCNQTLIVNETPQTLWWKQYANDSSNNWATSENFSLITTDVDAPTYSQNSTNSTLAGTPVQHDLYWTDNVALSGYVFSFCNGTFSNTSTYSTGLLSPSANSTLKGKGWQTAANAYARDTSYAWANGNRTQNTNATNYSGFSAGVPSGATILGIQLYIRANCSSTTGVNTVYASVSNDSGTTWSAPFDTGDLGSFAWGNSTSSLWGLTWDSTAANNIMVNVTANATAVTRRMFLDWVAVNITYSNATSYDCDGSAASMVNDTWTGMTGAGNWSNVTKVVDSAAGDTVYWCVYANDTSNNWNGTSCVSSFNYLTTSAGNTCSCASIQAGTPINCAENCDIGACDVGGIAVTFINTGTITTSGDVTNILRTTWASGCKVIIGSGKRYG
jgi:hypothetical protein